MIIFAKMPEFEILQIINHFQLIMEEQYPRCTRNKLKDYQIICDEHYAYIDKFDEQIPNFLILNSNRNICMIYVISNNILNLISSMHLGFCILPVSNSINS